MKIEIGGIYTDKNIGGVVAEVTVQRPSDAQQLGQSLEWLNKTHHREPIHGIHAGKALRFHQRTTHTLYHQVGTPLAQRRQYSGAKNIAGGFSRQNAYAQATRPHLTNDAALRGAQGINEDLEFGGIGQHGFKPLQGNIEGQALTVDDFKGAT